MEQTTQYYIFKIVDDGPGIEAKYHDKIFDLFQTLKPRDEVEGSGMGLAIIKKAVNFHGGKIEISSQVGQGSCFSIHWPKNTNLTSSKPIGEH